MTGGIHIPQEELTLYAMQSLATEEQASLRRHLAECESCRTELAEISGDLALLAMSAEPHPLPQGARQRFLERIGAAAPAAETAVRRARAPSAFRRYTSRAFVWIPWTAVAVLLVVTIGLGMKLRFTNQELRRKSALASAHMAEVLRAREVLELLTAPNVQRVLLTGGAPHPAPSARALYLASQGALILQASNLKPLNADKIYELWLIPANGAAPMPAGLFRPDSLGSANIVLPQIPEGVQAKAFGVTVENAGGSTTPTAPIILSGAAASSGE